jgi:hypothetical protein
MVCSVRLADLLDLLDLPDLPDVKVSISMPATIVRS